VRVRPGEKHGEHREEGSRIINPTWDVLAACAPDASDDKPRPCPQRSEVLGAILATENEGSRRALRQFGDERTRTT
jgi:hypothetical protein